MNEIEEKLWNYIDGNCSTDEQQAISRLINEEEVYGSKYQELLRFNQEIAAMEPDEPSMAFTYNVMEVIRTEHARSPLKAAIDQRIIRAITAFFVLTIIAVLGYIMLSVNWSAGSLDIQMPRIKLPDMTGFFTGPLMKGFLIFDVILALFLFDSLLRKREVSKQG